MKYRSTKKTQHYYVLYSLLALFYVTSAQADPHITVYRPPVCSDSSPRKCDYQMRSGTSSIVSTTGNRDRLVTGRPLTTRLGFVIRTSSETGVGHAVIHYSFNEHPDGATLLELDREGVLNRDNYFTMRNITPGPQRVTFHFHLAAMDNGPNVGPVAFTYSEIVDFPAPRPTCSISSPSTVNLNHGTLSTGEASSHTSASVPVRIECTEPANVEISINGKTDLSTNIPSVKSTILFDSTPYKRSYSVNTSTTVNVASRLSWTGTQAGKVSASGVITINIL